MRLSRIFQNALLAPGENISLDEANSHYIKNVLRLKIQDELILFNGQGNEYKTTIREIKKNSVSVEIKTLVEKNIESPLTIHLGQIISRGEKMDFTLQKATELGATEITPLFSERCEIKLPPERWDKKLQHWQKIIISACEQSGRTILPRLNKPTQLITWMTARDEEVRWILHPHEHTMTPSLSADSSVVFTVGPEGGFTATEISTAKKHGFTPITLGPRILRTETAALAVIASLQTLAGDYFLT